MSNFKIENIKFKGGRYASSADVTIILPTRTPDYIDRVTFKDETIYYWFEEMVASVLYQDWGDGINYPLQECSTTGLLLAFIKDECHWYFETERAQHQYALWLAERAMLNGSV